jgi:hypothetical protein
MLLFHCDHLLLDSLSPLGAIGQSSPLIRREINFSREQGREIDGAYISKSLHVPRLRIYRLLLLNLSFL